MILGQHREQVIDNIRQALEQQDFYRKTETDDPQLTPAESRDITARYMARRETVGFRFKSFLARRIANVGSALLNKDTDIRIEGDLPDMTGGYILTSNHFSPLENTVVRQFVRRQGKSRLHIVSQVSNLAMTGWVGFLMNYADTLPLSQEPHYMRGPFQQVLQEWMNKKRAVLIYPEQELWFHYRQPRPLKRGVYDFAARLGAPVVCCFVEQVDKPAMDTEDFHQVKYILHVLGTLYPDPTKSVKENSVAMCCQDYAWKCAAYEAAYGRPVKYVFRPQDIAGWLEGRHEL